MFPPYYFIRKHAYTPNSVSILTFIHLLLNDIIFLKNGLTIILVNKIYVIKIIPSITLINLYEESM
jgi:hypothetical protein